MHHHRRAALWEHHHAANTAVHGGMPQCLQRHNDNTSHRVTSGESVKRISYSRRTVPSAFIAVATATSPVPNRISGQPGVSVVTTISPGSPMMARKPCNRCRSRYGKTSVSTSNRSILTLVLGLHRDAFRRIDYETRDGGPCLLHGNGRKLLGCDQVVVTKGEP